MKTQEFLYGTHHVDHELVLDALAALQEKTAIGGELLGHAPAALDEHEAGASIELRHENGTSRYTVECKSFVDRKAHIDQVYRQLASAGSAGLMIAPYISTELAEHCRAIGLQFIDASGNAHLRAPGLYVFATGAKRNAKQRSARTPKGLTNPASLRVVFALLSRPRLVNATFKEIASCAGVSLGTAHNVLEDLEHRGYLIDKGNTGRRQLLECPRLRDEWVINYPTTLRTKLHGRRFSAPDPYWWQHVDPRAFDMAWGAEVAAMKMTGHLKPATQTLYVAPNAMDDAINSLARQCRIRPDPDGPIEILEKFWHWNVDIMSDVAPALLVYAELLAILDPRTQETAGLIKEHFIDPAFDQG